jgi:hypothetical protein
MGPETLAWQHSQTPRGIENVSTSRSYAGRFGRLFRSLPAASFTDAQLTALANAMVSPPRDVAFGAADAEENADIPAGYTYFGQFITHDLTFDPSTLGERVSDPEGTTDYRTPRLDLDSLYGRGQLDQPYLYDQQGKLLTGRPLSAQKQYAGPDLPRASNGRAIIGDPRNDENKIISQLHSLFMSLHNKMVDLFRGDVSQAQREVRWTYQYLVVKDFLPKVVPQELIDSILSDAPPIAANGYANAKRLSPELRLFKPHQDAFLPVEFSAAAFRFGHSMIRPSYLINDAVRPAGMNRIPVFAPGNGATADLRSMGPLPDEWGIQWGYFFDVRNDARFPQKAYLIDEFLSSPLSSLPDPVVTAPPGALARRTLQRAVDLGLPSGQDVAASLGLMPLTNDELFTDPGLGSIFRNGAPLWYYILREAKVLEKGKRLGPVGATIVAEVILGLLWHDSQSYLRRNPAFVPRYPSMPDLIRGIGAPI